MCLFLSLAKVSWSDNFPVDMSAEGWWDSTGERNTGKELALVTFGLWTREVLSHEQAYVREVSRDGDSYRDPHRSTAKPGRALGLCRLEGQIHSAFYSVRSVSSVGSRVDGENVVTEGSHSRMLK